MPAWVERGAGGTERNDRGFVKDAHRGNMMMYILWISNSLDFCGFLQKSVDF